MGKIKFDLWLILNVYNVNKKIHQTGTMSIIEVELVKSRNNCQRIKESKPHYHYKNSPFCSKLTQPQSSHLGEKNGENEWG
jgi:hypothetical protein